MSIIVQKRNASTLLAVLIVNLLLGAFIVGLFSYMTVIKKRTETSIDREKAIFLAQKGIAYAAVELRLHGYNWFTHNMSENTKCLTSKSGVGIILNTTADIGPNGNYRPMSDDSVLVRVYKDKKGNIWIRSKGKSNSTEIILLSGVTTDSLYDYFLFIPDSNPYLPGHYNGEGIGRIYVSGSAIFSERTHLANIPEFILASNGSFQQYHNTYYSAESLAEKAAIGSGIKGYGEEYLPRLDPNTKHTYSDLKPIPWEKDKYGFSQAWIPRQWQPLDAIFYVQDNSAGHISFSSKYTTGSISEDVADINIPVRFEGYKWDWKDYKNRQATATNKGVIFTDESGNIADMTYWDKIKETSKNQYFAGNPYVKDDDLLSPYLRKTTVNGIETYEYFIPKDKEALSVDYLNSYAQEEAWENWLKNAKDSDNKVYDLSQIFKDGHNGGKDLAPLEIDTAFKTIAKSSGLYVSPVLVADYLDGSVKISTKIYISEGGSHEYLCVVKGNGKLEESDKCPKWLSESFRLKKDYFANLFAGVLKNYTEDKEDLLEIDVGKLKEHLDKTGVENVLFFDLKKSKLSKDDVIVTSNLVKYYKNIQESYGYKETWVDMVVNSFKNNIINFYTLNKNYLAENGVILENGEEIPKEGLTIITPQNIYVHGDFNLHTSSKLSEDTWAPASFISDSRIVLLSDNFTFPDKIPMGWTPPNYPYELAVITDDFDGKGISLDLTSSTYDWDKLEERCKKLFALPDSFNLNKMRMGAEPKDVRYLLKEIRNAYYNYYRSDVNNAIPNVIGNGSKKEMYVNASIVSPGGYTPVFLEMGNYDIEWVVKNSGTGIMFNSKSADFMIHTKGSMIKLKKHWSDEYDDRWEKSPYRSYISATGSSTKYMKYGIFFSSIWPDEHYRAHYEAQYNKEKPPGDFSSGTNNLWLPVNDFDHHQL